MYGMFIPNFTARAGAHTDRSACALCGGPIGFGRAFRLDDDGSIAHCACEAKARARRVAEHARAHRYIPTAIHQPEEQPA